MISIRPYKSEDDDALVKLCSIPVSGDIVLSLERSPSYIKGSEIQTLNPKVFVCEDQKSDTLVGVFNVGERPVYIDGSVSLIHYLCDLRIHPAYQNGSLFHRIMLFLKKLDLSWSVIPGLTVVFADNHRMIKMIERRMAMGDNDQIPVYHQAAAITSFLFSSRTKFNRNPAYTVRKANEKDISKMQELSAKEFSPLPFAPYEKILTSASDYYHGLSVREYWVLCEKSDEESVLAFAAIWDTSDIKFTRILRYPQLLSFLRIMLPFIPFVHSPRLPKPGKTLKTTYIHHIVVKDRTSELFGSLLEGMLWNSKTKTNYLATLDAKDPLFPVLNKLRFSNKMKGFVYLVNYDLDESQLVKPPYFIIDPARI